MRVEKATIGDGYLRKLKSEKMVLNHSGAQREILKMIQGGLIEIEALSIFSLSLYLRRIKTLILLEDLQKPMRHEIWRFYTLTARKVATMIGSII